MPYPNNQVCLYFAALYGFPPPTTGLGNENDLGLPPNLANSRPAWTLTVTKCKLGKDGLEAQELWSLDHLDLVPSTP